MTDKENEIKERKSVVKFAKNSRQDFARNGLNQLNLDQSKITIGEYTQIEVRELIEKYADPTSQVSLLEVADILYIRSPHFRRLVQYFAGMATFSYAVVPSEDITEMDPAKLKEDYLSLARFSKTMNMPHEFRKIMLEIFKSEIFFGYVHYTEDDFYIQKMPREACMISSVEDGAFNYSVHMPTIDENIEIYKYTMPEEVITLYNEWQNEQSKQSNNRNNRSGGRGPTKVKKETEKVVGDWKELAPQNTICIKFDEANYNMTIPPFAGTFDSVFEIDGYKASRRNKEQINNYMMVFQRIPMRNDSGDNNDFTIDYDSVEFFHEELASSVPDSVGVVTTPMVLEPIEFDKDSIDVDNVSKAERDFWSGTGTSQSLFSTENNTTQGINASIKTDEQIVFVLLRQFERWTNRFVKYAFGETEFSVDILDVTYFNQGSYLETMLELSQYGVPVKTLIASSMGIEPIQVAGLAFLENDVFGIHESWIPLQSSHTMSNKDREAKSPKDTGGRPTKDVEDLSDESLRKT